ncbi:MAG TPA: hypothetical protein VHT24_16080 [Pseudacidobacterium sp.]|nr:hypothetical protein [Pseudacidobacterium sp.]
MLREAETFDKSLQGWHDNTIQGRIDRENRERSDAKQTHRSQAAIDSLINWVDSSWWDATLKDYRETYVPELLKLRRELLAEVPEAAREDWYNDWSDPGIQAE